MTELALNSAIRHGFLELRSRVQQQLRHVSIDSKGLQTYTASTVIQSRRVLHSKPHHHGQVATKDEPDLSNKFKNVMRNVPHPLAVIASSPTLDQPSMSNQTPEAMLVSSFNSVTASPTPYVSFNVKMPSSTMAAIQSSKRFLASVINSSHTADVFAQVIKKDKIAWEEFLQADGKLRPGHGGVAWMECEHTGHSDIGDHRIIVAKVLEAAVYPDIDRKATPMVRWQGLYVNVGRDNTV